MTEKEADVGYSQGRSPKKQSEDARAANYIGIATIIAIAVGALWWGINVLSQTPQSF